MLNHHLLPIAALALLTAAPASALLEVRYDGTALIHFNTSTGQGHPGAVNGVHGFQATFYYDDLGNQLAATLRVDDIVRSHFDFCPGGGFGYCPPLSLGPTFIGSATGTTPEAYITTYVGSPGGFGGMPLPGALPRHYTLLPADDSFAWLSWSLFDNASGFAWNDGTGSIESITLAVPEPADWMLMLAGFALTGSLLRFQRRPQPARPVNAPARHRTPAVAAPAR
jgi:hypothetical protein